MVADADGTNHTKITDNALEWSWSPDSTRITYYARADRSTFLYELWIADADGTNPTKIVDNVWWYFWSPMSFQAAMSRP